MYDIDNNLFHKWKHAEVTMNLFKVLKDFREEIDENLTNAALVMELHSEKKLAYLVGKRDLIETLLNIQLNDLIEESSDES